MNTFSYRDENKPETCDLEDDVDVVSQRVQVLEGQLKRDSVGVEEGTQLKKTKEEEKLSDQVLQNSPCFSTNQLLYMCVVTWMLIPLTSRAGFRGSLQLVFMRKNCFISSRLSLRTHCNTETDRSHRDRTFQKQTSVTGFDLRRFQCDRRLGFN